MRNSIAAFVLLVAACQQKPAQISYEGADYKTETQKIAHGKRLAVVLDCTGCHGLNLRGTNVAEKPEDGAMYAPNISLMLGKYSDAELDRLIRHGVPRDGREFWYMSVESFQFLSDKDLAALIAYLRTVPSGGKPLPPFKLNRVEQEDVDAGNFGNAQAQIARYRDHPPIDLGPQHAWARYMVETTCTACHSNALQGWPNFTPNLDIAGTYSKVELTRLLTTGQSKTGKDVGMSHIARRMFSHLTPRERGCNRRWLRARANRPQDVFAPDAARARSHRRLHPRSRQPAAGGRHELAQRQITWRKMSAFHPLRTSGRLGILPVLTQGE